MKLRLALPGHEFVVAFYQFQKVVRLDDVGKDDCALLGHLIDEVS